VLNMSVSLSVSVEASASGFAWGPFPPGK